MLSLLLLTASFAVPFGHGPAELGLLREPESSPEAPGSLAVDAEGRTFVLDAVNERVVVFAKSGRVEAIIPLPSDTIEDFALLPSGDLAVLDRLVDHTVSVIAPNGAILARAPVTGAGVDDGGEVTAIFADDTGVWLEVLHGPQVRVLEGDFQGGHGRVDDKRATRPGLPLRTATGTEYVRLRKVGDRAQVLFFDDRGALKGDGAVSFSSLLELSGLVVNGEAIFVAGHELVQRRPGEKPARDAVVVVELARDVRGALVERARHTAKASPEFVPLKQLVPAGTGVAHLFVDSSAVARGARAVEVTSW